MVFYMEKVKRLQYNCAMHSSYGCGCSITVQCTPRMAAALPVLCTPRRAAVALPVLCTPRTAGESQGAQRRWGCDSTQALPLRSSTE